MKALHAVGAVAALGVSAAFLGVPPFEDIRSDAPEADPVSPDDVVDVQEWSTGVRQGVTDFGPAPRASCEPRGAQEQADRRCQITFSGSFRTDARRGVEEGGDPSYHGTYEGTAIVTYGSSGGPLAQVDEGSVRYRVKDDGAGRWLGDFTLDVGEGSTLWGFPGDDEVRFDLVETNERLGLTLDVSGVAVNALDDDLQPVPSYTDLARYERS